MALVQEVELAETKMALLNTISVIVERLEHNVSHQNPCGYTFHSRLRKIASSKVSNTAFRRLPIAP